MSTRLEQASREAQHNINNALQPLMGACDDLLVSPIWVMSMVETRQCLERIRDAVIALRAAMPLPPTNVFPGMLVVKTRFGHVAYRCKAQGSGLYVTVIPGTDVMECEVDDG